jgi:undecaprenyl diphosphate synthase
MINAPQPFDILFVEEAWQISYAELLVLEKCWPDFTEADLHEAIRAYAGRERRYGRVKERDS